jgi:hypothetical protein
MRITRFAAVFTVAALLLAAGLAAACTFGVPVPQRFLPSGPLVVPGDSFLAHGPVRWMPLTSMLAAPDVMVTAPNGVSMQAALAEVSTDSVGVAFPGEVRRMVLQGVVVSQSSGWSAKISRLVLTSIRRPPGPIPPAVSSSDGAGLLAAFSAMSFGTIVADDVVVDGPNAVFTVGQVEGDGYEPGGFRVLRARDLFVRGRDPARAGTATFSLGSMRLDGVPVPQGATASASSSRGSLLPFALMGWKPSAFAADRILFHSSSATVSVAAVASDPSRFDLMGGRAWSDDMSALPPWVAAAWPKGILFTAHGAETTNGVAKMTLEVPTIGALDLVGEPSRSAAGGVVSGALSRVVVGWTDGGLLTRAIAGVSPSAGGEAGARRRILTLLSPLAVFAAARGQSDAMDVLSAFMANPGQLSVTITPNQVFNFLSPAKIDPSRIGVVLSYHPPVR